MWELLSEDMGGFRENYFKKAFIYDIKEDGIIELNGDTEHLNRNENVVFKNHFLNL